MLLVALTPWLPLALPTHSLHDAHTGTLTENHK